MDEDADIVADEPMDPNVVDEKNSVGKIPINSGAADNVHPRDYFPDILL